MTKSRFEQQQSQTQTQTAALVHGNLWKAIWIMSWPLMLTTMSTSLIGLTDMWVAGRLSAGSQAAVGLSEQVLFLFMVFIMSVGVGTTAMVARATGADKADEAMESAAQSLSLSFAMGVVLALTSLSCAKFGLAFFSQAPDVVSQAKDYLGVYSLYLIPFSMVCIINASFRAIGDAKTPLFIVACMTVVNIIGDYVTVLGNWPIPGLGLRGIAISGITASLMGSFMGLFFLSRSSLGPCLKRLWPVYPDYIKRILKIGVPTGLQRIGWSLSVFVLFRILVLCPHPTQAIASWTIGMRLEALLFMPLMALSLAVSSIVGQNLGANRIDRAVSAGWKVTGVGIVLMLIFGAALFYFAPSLAARMTQDPDAIAYTTRYLQINACGEPLLALTMVLGGALQGAGDTRTPMIITLCSHWIFRLPIAWLLALTLGMGPTGVWLAMAASSMVSASLTTFWFNSKKWVKTKV